MRVEEMASPLPALHAGSVMLSPRMRSNSVSGGAGGSSSASSSAPPDPAACAAMRERIIAALKESPAGLQTSVLETFGDNRVVLDAMNKLMSDRMIGLFSLGGQAMLRLVMGEEHLADLRYGRGRRERGWANQGDANLPAVVTFGRRLGSQPQTPMRVPPVLLRRMVFWMLYCGDGGSGEVCLTVTPTAGRDSSVRLEIL